MRLRIVLREQKKNIENIPRSKGVICEMWMKQRIKEVLCFRVFKISGERERDKKAFVCCVSCLVAVGTGQGTVS